MCTIYTWTTPDGKQVVVGGQVVGNVVRVGRATGGVAIATYRRRHALAFGILKFDAAGSFIPTHNIRVGILVKAR